ncbi:hypothetical protein QBC38DRAFT_406975 [Podospora fimiseda]|uniref:DUF7492 domain-containing protein n=1 Tax=Podospora fimiseda TaxID=252190 RepID=A0AAN7H5E5_9PEZI|nr:hypothetical protein QBC38DRAFT_406975 [Podospora fimiseda]
MIGPPGFDRAHFERGTGPQQDYLVPPNGGPKIYFPDLKLVKESQRKLTDTSYSSQFPKLKVAPGDFIAIQYAENGHVTKPDAANPFKPINRGTIYLYGTTETDLESVNFVDVHLKWTADGKGGNGNGRLLATRNYDDGQCHEPVPMGPNGQPLDAEGILSFRKKFISHGDALLCQSDVQIPVDVPVGKTYTIIWVWDWPDMNVQGVAVPPASYYANQTDSSEPYVTIPESYTGVLDYEVVDPCDEVLGSLKGPTCGNKKSRDVAKVQFAPNQDPKTRGIQRQMLNPFLVKVPQAGFDVKTAQADPNNIPLKSLIGLKEKPKLPLGGEILAASASASAPASSSPSTSASSSTSAVRPPCASSKPSQATTASSVVYVTVTVPEATQFVTVYQTMPTPSSRIV